MRLMKHQLDAVDKLSSGKVLYGGVGTGKGATILGYYEKYQSPKDLYVITTAKKRNSLDWMREAASFGIGLTADETVGGVLTVDSYNNISNYEDVTNAFFVFDEQRLVGSGSWVKSFQRIAKQNDWVLLTGTPGDNWMDYAPLFIANGFYKNITEFKRRHVLYEPYVKFPKIRGYLDEQRLQILRNDILVEMPYIKHTKRVLNWMDVTYDQKLFDKAYKERWHVYEDRPIKDMAELFRVLRRIVNSDPSRLEMVDKLWKSHPRLIVFYNFNYELDILRTLHGGLNVFEYNGQVKDPVPTGESWVYLVQYIAGAEAWNCTTTDTEVMYSLNYSYKIFEQVQGRTDRLDTPYVDLFYYIFVSNSIVDRAIKRALGVKENFNEKRFIEEVEDFDLVDRHRTEVPPEVDVDYCEI